MISRPNPQVIEMSGFVGIDSENGLTIWVGVCRLPSCDFWGSDLEPGMM